MAIDKRINYNVQGNVKNYLGKQKIVKAPLHWQSAPNHPTTELAYITKKEKDLLIKKDLHKSLKGGVNRGPSGIMSLNGWGSSDASQERAGADISAAMDASASDAGWSSPGGGGGAYSTAKSPAELKILADQAGSSTVMPESFYGRTYRAPKSGFGKFFGGLGRGLLSIFGGIPGKIASGIMTAKNLAKRTGQNISEFAEYDEEGKPLYPTLDRYLNRNTDKYKIQAIKPIEKIGQDIDTGYSRTHLQSLANEMDANDMNTQPINQNLYPTAGLGSAEGGRIGYEHGGRHWYDQVYPFDIMPWPLKDIAKHFGKFKKDDPSTWVGGMTGKSLGILDEHNKRLKLGLDNKAEGGIARLL